MRSSSFPNLSGSAEDLASCLNTNADTYVPPQVSSKDYEKNTASQQSHQRIEVMTNNSKIQSTMNNNDVNQDGNADENNDVDDAENENIDDGQDGRDGTTFVSMVDVD